MTDDHGWFLALLKDQEVNKTFYRLMKQLHTMLQRTTTIQGQSEIR